MDIAGWWAALGVTFAVVELAAVLVDRSAETSRKDLGKRAMKLAYVRTAPRLGGGLAAGRTVLMARVLPLMALVGLALAFLSSAALTIFSGAAGLHMRHERSDVLDRRTDFEAGEGIGGAGHMAEPLVPRYRSLPENVGLYRALSTPFYIGIGAAYLVVLVLLFSCVQARRRARTPESLSPVRPQAP